MDNPKQQGGLTGPGLTVKKAEDFPKWYSEIITLAELIEYYDISGCYILRPYAFSIWEQIVAFFDKEIKKEGVKNASFPLLVSKSALEKEKNHIAGFSAEVAWVTESGQSELPQPVAIRPTSETIIYPAYAKWIRSHRDLPLKLNQWTNVVRWEFKHPVPFLRSREFLWQEGHSAFATEPEADAEVRVILELYRRVYEEYLAVPVIPGMKSEGEKFAGGKYTTTVEAFIPQNGRGIQGATSHCLGQNFSKMFNIKFEDEKGAKQLAWQTCWGLTTRTLGVLLMVHGDDKGLVLPPKVAPLQVVIVPIFVKNKPNDKLSERANEIAKILVERGVRCYFDDRANYSPGWKYNHWELKGVPLRVELGHKDLEANQCVFARRDFDDADKAILTENGSDSGQQKVKKESIPLAEVGDRVAALLDNIQQQMFIRAKKTRDDHLKVAHTFDEFLTALDGGNLVLTPWCDQEDCEEQAKKKSAGKEAQQEEETKVEEPRKLEKQKETLRKKIERLQKELAALENPEAHAQVQEQPKEQPKEEPKEEPKETEKPKQRRRDKKKEKKEKQEEKQDNPEEIKNFGLKAAAKTLCKPFSQDYVKLVDLSKPCFSCGKASSTVALWGRSY